MYVEVEDLVPGEVFERSGRPVIFEGPGLTGGATEVLGFRDMETNSKVILAAPEVERFKGGIGDFRERFGKTQGLREYQLLERWNHLGSDPEFFLEMPSLNEESGWEFVPAFAVYPAKSSGKNLFWDGFQGEFRTQAQTCIEAHTVCVKRQLEAAVYNAQKKLSRLDPGKPIKDQMRFRIRASSVIRLEKELERATPEQVALGCEGSSNAYGIRGIPVMEPRRLKYRFAGGHIHIGYTHKFLTEKMLVESVKCMDMLAAIPSVIMAEGWDDPIRRKFYGQAGEYRLPKHGLEYRTLSNFWLREPAVTQLMFGLVRGAFHWGLNGWRLLFAPVESEIIEIVQKSDVVGARKWLGEHEKLFVEFMQFARIAYATSTFEVLMGKREFNHQFDFSRWNLWSGRGEYCERWGTRVFALPLEIRK